MNTPQQKTPGQIAFEAYANDSINAAWENLPHVTRPRWEAAAIAVLASQWRSVTEPPPSADKVLAITDSVDDACCVLPTNIGTSRKFWMTIPPLPQPPIDPYAELKAAHAAGKVIQINLGDSSDRWIDAFQLSWSETPDKYRIKPWTLTNHLHGFRALEPGESWHRNDFTEEMLPEGWRPLLLGEPERGTDLQFWRHGEWQNQLTFGEALATDNPRRTRHPLPPTKQELERKEFEDAFSQGTFEQNFTRSDGTNYDDASVRCRWQGWQAAREITKKAKVMTLNTIRILGLSLMTMATVSNLLNTCTPHVRLFIWSVAALGAAIWGSTVIVRMFDRSTKK